MPSHTGTGEWKSFEIRMRRRRAERLVLRADVAIGEGHLDAARAAFDEARTLWPTAPGLDEVERNLAAAANPPPAIAPPRRHLAWLEFAAAASVVACLAAAVATFLIRMPYALHARSVDAIVGAPLVADSASGPPPSAPVADAATTDPPPVADDERPAVSDITPPVSPDRARPSAVPLPEPLSEPVHLEPARPDPVGSEPVHLEPVRPEPVSSEPVHLEPVRPAPVRTDTPIATSGVSTPVQPLPEPAVAPAPVAPPPATPPPPGAVEDSAVRSTAVASTPAQDALVRDTLAAYAKAYNDLDVGEAARVWPGVDRSALSRAFDQLDSEQISLGDCRVQIDSATAQAHCAGTATWKPRVGGGERTDPRSWTFDLRKAADGWQIVSARVQRR